MEVKKLKSAEDYLKLSVGLQLEDGLKLLEEMNPFQGEIVLDLGCGTGNLSSVIAERVGARGKVMAVDPDGHRIALARKNFDHMQNLTFAEGSSDSLLAFEKSCFDAVFSNYVFHFIKDKKSVLKNIYESLKPGGRVAMQFCATIPPLLEKAVKNLNPEENYKRLKEMFFMEGKEKIESYCRLAGFDIIKTTEIELCTIHGNLPDYLALASASTDGVLDLDLIKEENLKEFKLLLDKEGRIFNVYPVFFLIAKKSL